MPDYKSMYFRLSAQVADAVELLIQALVEGEESALSDADKPSLTLVEERKNTAAE